MRQMLLRIPDDLHARMARAARERGTSVNALANEILDEVIPAELSDARTKLRERARRLGVLANTQRSIPPTESAWRHALESTRGIGPVLDDIFADGR